MGGGGGVVTRAVEVGFARGRLRWGWRVGGGGGASARVASVRALYIPIAAHESHRTTKNTTYIYIYTYLIALSNSKLINGGMPLL